MSTRPCCAVCVCVCVRVTALAKLAVSLLAMEEMETWKDEKEGEVREKRRDLEAKRMGPVR